MNYGWMYDLQYYVVSDYLTVFQSYQDNGRVTMNGYMQLNLVYGLKEFRY